MAQHQRLLEVSKFTDTDLVCFSHLRWDFVYQRPQHLLSRLGKQFRTFFIEEPIYHNAADTYQIRLTSEDVWVMIPQLNEKDTGKQSVVTRLKHLLGLLFNHKKIEKYILW